MGTGKEMEKRRDGQRAPPLCLYRWSVLACTLALFMLCRVIPLLVEDPLSLYFQSPRSSPSASDKAPYPLANTSERVSVLSRQSVRCIMWATMGVWYFVIAPSLKQLLRC